MEYDRYQKNRKLFVVALVSMVFSFIFIAFSLFMMPHLLFGWQYDTPEFITIWREWLRNQYDITEQAASKIMFLFFFCVSLIFVMIAYFSSNRIESQIFNQELQDAKSAGNYKAPSNEGLRLTLKILSIVIGIIVISVFVQWFIYRTGPLAG